MFVVKDVVVQPAHVGGGGRTCLLLGGGGQNMSAVGGGAEKVLSCILHLYFQIHSRVSHL